LTLWRQGWTLVRFIFIFYPVRLPLCNKYSDYIVTFISIHSVIICVVLFGTYMRCTRLCPLNSGVTPARRAQVFARGRAARAERERERVCAKWDGEASAGAGGAQKGAGVRGRATWPGISACVCACCWSTAGRREGGADRGGPTTQRERAGARQNGSAS
jgi:hypothetical protein